MKLKKLKNKLPSEQSTALLNVKYPHINYISGENLNLHDAFLTMLKGMWVDKIKYPSIKHMEKRLNMTERGIIRVAKLNNLGERKHI